MRLKVRISILAVLAVIGLGACGGYYYHHYYLPRVRTTSIRFRRSKYLDRSNRSLTGQPIGQQRLISRNLRAPQMKLAKSVVVMDSRTGQIIYQRNENQLRKVASVAKLMTLFLVEQKINRLHGGWHRVVNTSNPALQKMSRDKSIGGFKFYPHHRYTVQDLFRAALIQSSNNSAIALSQWVAGSNAKFVKMMNAQARAWHLNARFISPSGLENDDLSKYKLAVTRNKNDGNLLSAKDVAVIAQHLLMKYPSILRDSKRPQIKIAGQHLNNLNNLLPGKTYAKKGLKVDGLKTGFTPNAGFCFVGTEQPNRHKDRIITVVLHDDKEFTDTRSLMNFIYKNDRALNH